MSFITTEIFSVFNLDCFPTEGTTISHFLSNIFTYSLLGVVQYILVCAIFEFRNPMPKCKLRIENMRKEIKLGVFQIFCQSVYSMTFYHFIYPYTKWYRYFDINGFSLWSFIYGMGFLYMWTSCKFCYYSVFGYWVHRMFHIGVLYKWVHNVHHQFKEPTPFGYCATHPLEGLTEVSTVLHVAELLLPLHPLMTLFFFEYITIHEIMGHDGGEFDDSDHYRHHLYYVVNYGDAIMDKYFGTSYEPKNYPVKAKCSYTDNIDDKKGAIFMKYK